MKVGKGKLVQIARDYFIHGDERIHIFTVEQDPFLDSSRNWIVAEGSICSLPDTEAIREAFGLSLEPGTKKLVRFGCEEIKGEERGEMKQEQGCCDIVTRDSGPFRSPAESLGGDANNLLIIFRRYANGKCIDERQLFRGPGFSEDAWEKKMKTQERTKR